MFRLILIIAVFLSASVLQAQKTEFKCGTMEYLKKQKEDDPSLGVRMLFQEMELQRWIHGNNKLKGKPGGGTTPPSQTITIPVIVHIIYNTDEQNLSDERVFKQIEITNKDYAGLNYHSMGAFSSSLKSDTKIQFCLAQKAPDGSPTNGIERRYTDTISFPPNNNMKYYNTGGLDAWDPTMYLNIWICNLENYAGYAQFPSTGINSTYGVVVLYWCFGSTDSTIYRGMGACNTHEIGHCLNLRHIWGDDNGACTGTDYCDDTPNQANSTIGGPIGVLTDDCSPTSPGIMYMNFMDYSRDEVMANFTPNQTARMQACFASPGGPLLPLLSSTACLAPSDCEIPTSLKVNSITKSSAVLGWTAMYGAVSYNISYRKVGASSWISTSSNTNSVTADGLSAKTSYEFQVQTVCASGTSNFSASTTFKTLNNSGRSLTDVNDLSITEGIEIFPNPATDQVTIIYSVANQGFVTMSINNSLGIESASINNNQWQEAGTYSINFDVSKLSSGLYYLTFQAGSGNVTKKFAIIR
ncbi:MAG: M43 family zinc metalloprotease [bacterium]